jgi:hypothetical protein
MPGLFDMGFGNVELWRSEEMQLVQVRPRRAPAALAAPLRG